MILHDDLYKQGYLNINKDNLWEFVSRDLDGRITFTHSLSDIQYSWKIRMEENTFNIGWQECARQVYGTGRHVSAIDLHNTTCAPANLRQAVASNNPDNRI